MDVPSEGFCGSICLCRKESEAGFLLCALGGWGKNATPPVMYVAFPATALCNSSLTPQRPLFLVEFLLNDYDSSFTPFSCLKHFFTMTHTRDFPRNPESCYSTGQSDWWLWNCPNSKMVHLSQVNQKELLPLPSSHPLCLNLWPKGN